MQQLQIDGAKAKLLYPGASKEFKEILHASFGEKFFLENIKDRINSFEDCCGLVGEDPLDSKFSEGPLDEINYRKIKVIVAAYNEGWMPDWNNSGQLKWFLWFYYNNPGFRVFDAGFVNAASRCGSRFAFKEESLALDAGSKFLDTFKGFMTY